MLSMKNFSYISSISQADQIAKNLQNYKNNYKMKESVASPKLRRRSTLKKSTSNLSDMSNLSNSSSNSKDNTTATNIIYHIKKSTKTLYKKYNQLKNSKEKMDFISKLEPKEFRKLMKRIQKKKE